MVQSELLGVSTKVHNCSFCEMELCLSKGSTETLRMAYVFSKGLLILTLNNVVEMLSILSRMICFFLVLRALNEQ